MKLVKITPQAIRAAIQDVLAANDGKPLPIITNEPLSKMDFDGDNLTYITIKEESMNKTELRSKVTALQQKYQQAFNLLVTDCSMSQVLGLSESDLQVTGKSLKIDLEDINFIIKTYKK